jgi:hypothetical protein
LLLRRYFNNIKLIFRTNELSKVKKADIILMSGDHDLGYRLNNGKKYAQILDSLNLILKNFNFYTFSIALPGSQIFGSKTFSNSISVNGLIYRAHLLERIISKLHLSQFFDGNFIVNTWLRILSKTKAKVIFAIQPTPELCIAANKLGIDVCDYQHGVISAENYYGFCYRKKFNNLGWPNYILCWDKDSKKWVEENISSNSVPVLVGNPWYLIFKNNLFKDVFSKGFEIKNNLTFKNGPIILITLQWGLENDLDNNEIGVNKFLYQLMLNKHLSFNWLLRIHPIQFNSEIYICKIKELLSSLENVEWEVASSLPLPILLKNIDLHITSHSAVTIEAESFNIKTALLNNNHAILHDYFGSQIYKGIAEIVEPTYENILDWVNKNIPSNNTYLETNLEIKLINNFLNNILKLKNNEY